MNYYGLLGVYICVSTHVVLWSYIHVIFVYGLYKKIGETLSIFFGKSTFVQYSYSI